MFLKLRRKAICPSAGTGPLEWCFFSNVPCTFFRRVKCNRKFNMRWKLGLWRLYRDWLRRLNDSSKPTLSGVVELV